MLTTPTFIIAEAEVVSSTMTSLETSPLMTSMYITRPVKVKHRSYRLSGYLRVMLFLRILA